jgi:hypothetical protein
MSINELKEYFKLPAEDFDACNPIHWWVGWQAQFPNLFCLACDILCIPGESFLCSSIVTSSDVCLHLQVLLSPLKESSQVAGIPSPSVVLVFTLTPFVFSCLLRSGYILSVCRPMLPWDIKRYLNIHIHIFVQVNEVINHSMPPSTVQVHTMAVPIPILHRSLFVR